MHDEIEIKLNLQNKRNYTLLLNRLGPSVAIANQTNYFFDTGDRRLNQIGWALRLRNENGKCLMTLKGPRRAEGQCPSIRAEYEAAFDLGRLDEVLAIGLKASDCPDPIGLQLKALEIEGLLTKIIDFKNKRTTLAFSAFGVNRPAELDMTRFPDGSLDYELEMELDDPDEYPVAFGAIERLLGELEIPVLTMNDSKFARALKSSNLGHLYRETWNL